MRWLCWWRPPCLLRSVIVNFKDNETSAISGVLWSSRGPWLTFRSCSLLKAGQPPTAIDGDIVVPRANVAFLQVT